MAFKRGIKFKRKKIIKKSIITKIIKLIITFLLLTISIIIISKILKIHYIFDKFKNNNKINKINSFDGRIFLCTLYNNEAESAYIHIWRLYHYVDKFIIVISNLTYSGKPKFFI